MGQCTLSHYVTLQVGQPPGHVPVGSGCAAPWPPTAGAPPPPTTPTSSPTAVTPPPAPSRCARSRTTSARSGDKILLNHCQEIGYLWKEELTLLNPFKVKIWFSRLGFDLFSISQPQTETPGTSTPNSRTQCQAAQFTANSEGPNPPTICGINTGYHMILEVRLTSILSVIDASVLWYMYAICM